MPPSLPAPLFNDDAAMQELAALCSRGNLAALKAHASLPAARRSPKAMVELILLAISSIGANPEADGAGCVAALAPANPQDFPPGSSFILFHRLFFIFNIVLNVNEACAFRASFLDTARLLIDLGANIHELGRSGGRALCSAIKAGPDFAALLISRGAAIAPPDLACAIHENDIASLTRMVNLLSPSDSFIETLILRCELEKRQECAQALKATQERRSLEGELPPSPLARQTRI